MGQLFDKSLPELREAFVRARFAEPNIFGRPDIEEWLEGQRENLGRGIDPDPWTQDGFDNFVDADWDSNEPSTWKKVASLLLDYVTPSQSKPDWSDRNPSTSRLVEVIETLRAGGAKIFYPEIAPVFNDFMGIAIVEGKAYVILTEGDADVVGLGTTNKIMAVELIREEVRGDGRKAARALEFLLSQYRNAIKEVREAAQRDFDEAVAVSADGTKIVKAKWVWVVLSQPSWGDKHRIHGLLYPGSAFHGTKIRLAAKKKRIFDADRLASAKSESATVTVESCVKAMWLHTAGQTLVDDHTRTFDSLLSTTMYFCPSPLPDGGREIRV